MRPAFVLLAAVSLTGCAAVVEAVRTPPTADPARLHAGNYAVEPEHTRILFSVLHLGLTDYFGEFPGASGTVAFTPTDFSTMQLAVSVPASGISTTNAVLDSELRGAQWFDAARFPTLAYRSVRVTRTGTDTADIDGMLTMHGVTRPLTLHATLNGQGINPLDGKDTVGFGATGTLRRADYGLGYGIPFVSDAVMLTIAGAFEAAN